MKPRQVKRAIIKAILSNTPLFIWGPPGIGKTQMVAQVVRDINAGKLEIPDFNHKKENFHLITVPCTLIDPVELLGGLKVDEVTKWVRPELWPTDENWKGIIFFDELNAAIPAVQVACYRPAERDPDGTRWIGTHKLPQGVRIMAAGNRDTDRAVTHKMPSPLRSRYKHIDAEPFFEDWLSWAYENGIAPVVCAWISWHPAMLFNFDPKKDQRAYATSRSVAALSDEYLIGLDKDTELEDCSGVVGDEAAIDFISFLRIFEDRVDIEDIEHNPAGAEIPSEAGTKYALCAGLSMRADEDNFEAFITYTERIGEEFTYLFVYSAKNANPDVVATEAFIDWASKHNDFHQAA